MQLLPRFTEKILTPRGTAASRRAAEDLALRLRDHFAAVVGLACAGEGEIAREAVRRARRAGRAEAELRQAQRQRRPCEEGQR
jgi:hypothetical protein